MFHHCDRWTVPALWRKPCEHTAISKISQPNPLRHYTRCMMNILPIGMKAVHYCQCFSYQSLEFLQHQAEDTEIWRCGMKGHGLVMGLHRSVWWLDLVILKVFSYLDDSMILCSLCTCAFTVWMELSYFTYRMLRDDKDVTKREERVKWKHQTKAGGARREVDYCR